MAIEAARQMADSARIPSGYRLRYVTIQKALIVSSASGTETQFYLRPSKDTNPSFLQWSDFRICVYENNEWAETCSGAIAVEYEEDSTDPEEPTEASHLRNHYHSQYNVGDQNCKDLVNHKDMYELFEKIGLSYGTSFQSLRDIRYNNLGETIARVNLRHWIAHASESQHHLQSHVIHPTALDAIFQSTFPALTKGGTVPIPTMVPTKFRNIWVAANSDLSESTDVNIYAKCESEGYRNAKASIVALTVGGNEPCVIAGLEATFVAGNDKHSKDQGGGHLCYHLDWKPDLDFLNSEQIARFCTTGTEVKFAESAVKHEEEKRLTCYVSFARWLQSYQPEIIPKDKPHLKRYSEWMAHQVSNNRSNDLSTPETEWSTLIKDTSSLEQLCGRVERLDAEGRVISMVARNLASVMSGEVDGLDLLFHDKSLMEEYYRYFHSNNSAFCKLERYIDALAHKNPAMKMIEVGAGTGGATELVLGALMHSGHNEDAASRYNNYVYTDISPSFFENAKQKFKSAGDKLTFAVLNIELDLLAQGFQEGEYDLVIASHVGYD